jgi:hypothetical protein
VDALKEEEEGEAKKEEAEEAEKEEEEEDWLNTFDEFFVIE